MVIITYGSYTIYNFDKLSFLLGKSYRTHTQVRKVVNLGVLNHDLGVLNHDL